MGVMEGESAVQAVFGAKAGDPSLAEKTQQMRDDYEHQLDARFAAARGYVDAVLIPEETRRQLAFVLETCAGYRGPHLGAFVLPPLEYT
jgi:3-methylcrotonyl-CoA carboxylase beta subunit